MPNIIVDYSANLVETLDPTALARALHQAAVNCGTFPITGIRVFCRAHENFAVGHGDRDEAFVQIQVRIAPGRAEELKREIAAALFQAAEHALAASFSAGPLGLQLEISEFVEALTFQRNTMAK